MISEVVMPQMGADMTEGTLVKWLKNEGDAVERGEIIAEIETDKANVEIEAFEGGMFRKALAGEGDVVAVGGLIGIIAAADDDISQYVNGTGGNIPTDRPSATVAPENGATALFPEPEPAATPARTTTSAIPEPGARLRVSPVARHMAEDAAIDLRTIVGTGPDGRIIKRDIEAAMKGAPMKTGGPERGAAPKTGDRMIATTPSKMRQAIARRMSQSKREAPHYYLLLDIDMTAAMETRMQYNAALTAGDLAAPPETKVSINDMLVRAVALALRKHPEFNTTISEDGAIAEQQPQNICIGIALDDGLIAPAILDAGSKSPAQIAAESKDLVARAKGGRMRPAEINDGTFTITNLGAYGIETLIGIIQPPQTAILGVGSVMPQPVVRDGKVVVRQMVKVALSADHRATDGAQGAQFLAELKRLLESPLLLVL